MPEAAETQLAGPDPAPDDGAGSRGPLSAIRDWRFRIVFAVGGSIWLLGILFSFLATNPEPDHLALGVGGWAIYPVALAAAFWSPQQPRVLQGRLGIGFVVLLTLVAMLLVLVLDIGTYIQLFFFPAFAAARLGTGLVPVGGIGVVAVITTLTAIAGGAPLGTAWGVAVAEFFVALTVYSVGILQRTNRALLQARHELAAMAVAAERDRFARDLHDTLGHSLTMMALKSELAGRLVESDSTRARGEMADVAAAARASLAAVRETVAGYRQPTVDGELVAAEAALASAEIAFRVEGEAPRLESARSSVLGWALREGVTNIIRHSGARNVRIAFGWADGAVSMELIDDGEQALSARPGPDGPGTGLRGLAERVAAVGGEMDSGPLAGGGFRLAVSVPVESVP